jgi:secreted PhoX family phosphatase
MAVDENNNLWGANGAGISEISKSYFLLSTATNDGYMPTMGSNNNNNGNGGDWLSTAGGIAVDGAGSVWVANNRGYYGSSNLVEVNSGCVGLVQTANGGINNPSSVAIDPSGDIWVVNDANFGSNPNAVEEFSPATQTVPSGSSGYSAGGINSPSAIAIDHGGNAWIANSGNSSLT